MRVGTLCLLLSACSAWGQNTGPAAEGTYTSELLACTASAKAADAGRTGSKACEAKVKEKWGVPQ